MELIYSEEYLHNNKAYRLSLLHDREAYVLKIFRDNKPVHGLSTQISLEEANNIRNIQTVVSPLSEILVIAKDWLNKNV
jgi:hypothetical protein